MAIQRTVHSGEFEFDCRISGDEANEPVILLHGFPETSIMWDKLMDHLASCGFYCIAPDMRGYSKGACPKGASNYTVDKLSADIINISEALKLNSFHLIAHDWGAAVGWHVVYTNPKKIRSWTSLSIPHSKAFAKAYRTDPIQKKKSRYIGYFLLPWIPEFMIRRNDFKVFRKLWKNSTPEEINHYLSVFRRKESLTGALNYYRANIGKNKVQPVGLIETPTLFIWGKKDLAVGEVAAKGAEPYMKGDYTFIELDAGHWLIQTHFKEITPLIEAHLKKYTSA